MIRRVVIKRVTSNIYKWTAYYPVQSCPQQSRITRTKKKVDHTRKHDTHEDKLFPYIITHNLRHALNYFFWIHCWWKGKIEKNKIKPLLEGERGKVRTRATKRDRDRESGRGSWPREEERHIHTEREGENECERERNREERDRATPHTHTHREKKKVCVLRVLFVFGVAAAGARSCSNQQL